jgi:trehalose/maltose hydrolase-like predicted phosphorylase
MGSVDQRSVRVVPPGERRLSVTARSARRLDETFEALVFDWDGTAVTDRSADATLLRERVETLCSAGVHVFIVSGTHVANVDGQLRARPKGPGHLLLCLNRGSEVFEVGLEGPALGLRRTATDEEEAALDRAALLTVSALRVRGLEADVVSNRLNRRKIDLIPLPEWADPPKSRIAELEAAVSERLAGSGVRGLSEAVEIALGAARDAGISSPKVTSDVKHVEIGLTDKSDSARFAAKWLAERGITGQLVLVAGDEFGTLGGVPGSDSLMLVGEFERASVVSVGVEPEGVPPGVLPLGGGPAAFADLLQLQIQRRSDRRVPQVDEDPAWVIPLPRERSKQRAADALGTLETLGNGWAGTRGSREEDGASAPPAFAVGGVYDSHGTSLVPGPVWTSLDLRLSPSGERSEERILDMHTATLYRARRGSSFRSLRFVSGDPSHAMALRAEAPGESLEAGEALRAPDKAEQFDSEERGEVNVARSGKAPGGGIALAACDHVHTGRQTRTIERLAAWVADRNTPPNFDEALERFAEVGKKGFDNLLAEHRQAWARRWADCGVVIEGSPEDQLAARFNLFHLLSVATDIEEAAVGARGISGIAYSGHVFWDSDVFVLPALCALNPGAARAILEYRIHRLPAARAAARARGLEGARFPWESAADGSDVTPHWSEGPSGKLVPIRTGQREDHITADVAWAAKRYASWTADDAFILDRGRALLTDTARYWGSRIRTDQSGKGHIYGVIGPDEYHEPVDDNSFTNVMARWNLRQATDVVMATGREGEEARRWRELADALVDGWDPRRGIYEQFAGYFNLEPLLVSDFAHPPVAIDVLLGPDRVASSQAIKQADVLMLHHLVPEEVSPGSLEACLEFYEPRTAHGSSLSPAVHASLLARAGRPQNALDLFRLGARIDLDDVTGTTAGGLHLAAMGGTWQALAYGFLGLGEEEGVLKVDPVLPEEWEALELRFRFRGVPVGVRADHDSVTVNAGSPMTVKVGGMPACICDPPSRLFRTDRDRTQEGADGH